MLINVITIAFILQLYFTYIHNNSTEKEIWKKKIFISSLNYIYLFFNRCKHDVYITIFTGKKYYFHIIIIIITIVAITTYEIPSGHASYGPPSKAPSYSSPATHQYLPPPGAYSGGAPFSGAVAFEGTPSFSYLPTKYGIPLVEGKFLNCVIIIGLLYQIQLNVLRIQYNYKFHII